MIDSLYIDFGHHFEISDDSLLVIQRDITAGFGKHNVRDFGLWVAPHEGVVSGRRAYFRRTDMLRFDVDIKVWRDGKRHCMVKFSAPEILHGSNQYPIGAEELSPALDALMSGLSRVGITADLSQAHIIRLDLTRQGRMVDSFDAYARLLRRIHVPSTDLRERNSTTLWLHRQGNWAINVYDKSSQLNHGSESGNRVLRIELQLRTRRTVERVLGYSTVNELLANTDHLSEVYRSFLDRRLRIQSLLEASVTDGNTMNHIEHLVTSHRERGGERWRAEVLERLGLAFMCRELGVENTVSMLAPIQSGASSTERARHSRLLAKARGSVLDFEEKESVIEARGRNPARILKNVHEIINGRIT